MKAPSRFLVKTKLCQSSLQPDTETALTSGLCSAGIYSLQWDTLGQLLYTTSFEQSIVSVSLSPTARHLVVGLASRRVTLVSSDRLTYAQVRCMAYTSLCFNIYF